MLQMHGMWQHIRTTIMLHPLPGVWIVQYNPFAGWRTKNKIIDNRNSVKNIMCENCGCNSASSGTHGAENCTVHVDETIKVKVEQDMLHRNNNEAMSNRLYFADRNIYAVNLVSSPGSGKTAILENTIRTLSSLLPVFVIEGDQQTDNDARRIKAAGAGSLQINTGNGCHLDAFMISDALSKIRLDDNSILFIENVGNLVCPAMFDLGEQMCTVVMSVTEGEDKPLKYPYMFERSDVCLINKIDLIPYLNCNVELIRENLRRVNPAIKIFEVSAESGKGLLEWCGFLYGEATSGEK